LRINVADSMSRHRDVRNMATEEYEDDEDMVSYSSYGSSYVEETALSSSMEHYMYRRNSQSSTGHTPKMGHFMLSRNDSVPEEDEDEPLRFRYN